MKMTLSGKQLIDVLDFLCPDRDTDEEQTENEVTFIEEKEDFVSTCGENMKAGVYVYLTDYPEEGLYGPVGGLMTK